MKKFVIILAVATVSFIIYIVSSDDTLQDNFLFSTKPQNKKKSSPLKTRKVDPSIYANADKDLPQVETLLASLLQEFNKQKNNKVPTSSKNTKPSNELNIDYFKEKIIPKKAEHIARDIKNALGLNAYQTEKLKTLLIKTSKARTDQLKPLIEIIKAKGSIYFIKAQLGEKTISPEIKEKISKIIKIVNDKNSKINTQFNKDLAQLLDQNQIKKLQRYQAIKHNETISVIAQRQTKILNSSIPTLDQNQLNSITQHFQSLMIPEDKINLADANSLFSTNFLKNSNHIAELNNKITATLTLEQSEQYKFKIEQSLMAMNLFLYKNY